MCNFDYINFEKITLRVTYLLLFTYIDTNIRSKDFEKPLKKERTIAGASVIQKLHKPRLCVKNHYTHAGYYIENPLQV
jgi:hypothetical protein